MQFNEMPAESRVWLFQANRELSETECESLHKEVTDFLMSWQSHGNPMLAASAIHFGRVLVVAADENRMKATGCSIDKLNRFILQKGESMGVDLFDRKTVLFEDSGTLRALPLHEFWAMRKAGLIDDHTMVYDNTVSSLSEFERSWRRPFIDSWHQELWQR